MSTNADKLVSRGRVLSTISIGFILFSLGEGSFQNGITINLIGLSIQNEDIFYYFAIAGLFWAYWKYWMVNPHPVWSFFRRVQERGIGNELAPASVVSLALELSPKPTGQQRYYIRINSIEWFKMQITLLAKKKSRTNSCDFQHLIEIPFHIAIPWKLKHTIAAILTDEEFSNTLFPYFLAVAAIVITLPSYIPLIVLGYVLYRYIYVLFHVCLDHTGKPD